MRIFIGGGGDGGEANCHVVFVGPIGAVPASCWYSKDLPSSMLMLY